MGFLDKLLGKSKGLEDEYFDALIQLGEVVLRRPPRGVRLRSLAGAQQIARVREERSAALQAIEAEMEQEERRILAEADSEAAEKPDLDAEVRQNRGGLLNIERKVSNLRKQLVAKRANFKYFVKQLEAQEAKVQRFEDEGHFDQAESEREQLKRVRLDHMRQESSLVDLEEEIDILLDGEGAAGVAMRAKIRLEEIEENEKGRDKELHQVLGALEQEAREMEVEIEDSNEALEDALAALGEETYTARVRDPQFEQVYAILDPIASSLAGN